MPAKECLLINYCRIIKYLLEYYKTFSKVAASDSDGTPGFLADKIDTATMEIVDNKLKVKPGSGSGDMTKAVYDPDADGKIANAQLTSRTDLDDAIAKKHSNSLDHSNANDPTAGQKAALPGTSGTPSETNKYVTDDDSRNTNARTPTSHNHSENILHSLATARDDFLVASGVGTFIKKTLVEVKTILGLGSAAYTAATDYVTHALATAKDDFLVASGSGAFIKKTLAETLSILGKAAVNGLASLDASSKVVQEPASKGIASGIAPLDAASKVPTVNLGGAGASASNFLRGDQTWQVPAGGGSSPPWYGVLYSTQNDCDPISVLRLWTMGAIAGPTPTGIGTSIARCAMFTPPANITVNRIRLFGVGITANLYKFAIYPVGSSTSKLWDSGTVTTAANTWLNISTGLPITLIAGTKYWFCATAVSTGTVAGFRSLAAPLGTTFWGADAAPLGNRSLGLPVFAQFAVTTGVFPATLPAIAAAAYAGGTTGSIPFAFLDNVV